MRIDFRLHALLRMREDGIDLEEVREVVEGGDVVEGYPHDWPFPSELLLGWPRGRPVHAVVARNPQEEDAFVLITAYRPDPDRWDATFKERRP